MLIIRAGRAAPVFLHGTGRHVEPDMPSETEVRSCNSECYVCFHTLSLLARRPARSVTRPPERCPLLPHLLDLALIGRWRAATASPA